MKPHVFKSLAILVLVASCGGEPLEVVAGGPGTLGLPIFGGAPPDAEAHDAVVSLHQVFNGSQVYISPFCSGTLIADDVVLTAAHCMTTTRGRKIITTSPQAVAVYVGDKPAVDLIQHIYLVREVQVHSQYSPSRLVNDIALLRLSTPVTEPVTPVQPLPSSLGLTDSDIGATINFAGFGKTENGSIGVKLQVDGTLEGFGCSVAGCPDSGDRATQISYTQPQSGPCSGDSGGPAFIDRGETTYVTGITSYGDSYCTIYGVSTRVDAFEAFISTFLGGSEPPPDGCGDGICDEGESCDGQDGTLSCAADCPGKTGGKPNSRYCYVGGVCSGPGCK